MTQPLVSKSIYCDNTYYITVNGKLEQYSDFTLVKHRIDNLYDGSQNDTEQSNRVS